MKPEPTWQERMQAAEPGEAVPVSLEEMDESRRSVGTPWIEKKDQHKAPVPGQHCFNCGHWEYRTGAIGICGHYENDPGRISAPRTFGTQTCWLWELADRIPRVSSIDKPNRLEPYTEADQSRFVYEQQSRQCGKTLRHQTVKD